MPRAPLILSLGLLAASAVPASRAQTASPQAPAPPPPAANSLSAPVQAKLDQLQSILRSAQAAGDLKRQSAALELIGDLYQGVSDYAHALDFYQRALPLFQQTGNRDGESAALNNIARIHQDQGQEQEALDFYQRALAIRQALGDRAAVASLLSNIGGVYEYLGENQKAIDYFNRALPEEEAAGDRVTEDGTLSNLGNIYDTLGQSSKALDDYNKALGLARAAGDKKGEGIILNNLGDLSFHLDQKQQALAYYQQALPIRQALGDRQEQALTLNNIAAVYDSLGQGRQALDTYQQALALAQQIGDPDSQATTLDNLGGLYDVLGQPQQALRLYQQALPILHTIGDRDTEAEVRKDIGDVQRELHRQDQALASYNQGLSLFQATGDRDGEAVALNEIANIYAERGDLRKALDLYQQALPILGAVGDLHIESTTLSNIGHIYANQGDRQTALKDFTRSLSLAIAAQDPLDQAASFDDLLRAQRADQPALAIFYGKQAVNLIQQVRRNLQGLDQELQQSFFFSKLEAYRDLAGLLIQQKRLPEAEQVLDLLKAQEYRDFVRGAAAGELSPLPLTPAEQQAAADLQEAIQSVQTLRAQVAALKTLPTRTADQEKQYQQLSSSLDAASSRAINDYFQRLYVLFGSNSAANREVADVRGDVAALQQQIASLPDTVALYTVVTADRISIIVVAPHFTVPRESLIAEDDLNQKIAAFQNALRDPTQDPRPLARDLYNVLIAPVKADLDQAGARTLLWYLDGLLRYIPMAALYDGQHYLVENYALASLPALAALPMGIAHLADPSNPANVRALAMGISTQYEQDLVPLPTVVGELDNIVAASPGTPAHGVLPGTILLNGQFTESAMDAKLSQPQAVVHIASHFVLQPGDDDASWLLLAGKDADTGGYHLTVADFRDDPRLTLAATQLLTLSACNTDVATYSADGREVDGLATTAQLKGAKAVLSSLWDVNDASTGLLMADFYRRWVQGKGKTTKAEALRQAQLDLLRGTAQSQSAAGSPAPAFSHPFYWAPFVLTGNWR